MSNGIVDSLGDFASSEVEEDGENDNDDVEHTELGKLSEDEEPGWVMGTICKTVQHHMEHFRQNQMRLDKLMHPGWGDAADYFHERYMKYRMTELKFPAFMMPQTDTTAATPSATSFGGLMQALDIVPGQSQMPQVTSAQRRSQMRLGLEKAQADNHIESLTPNVVPDLSEMEIAKLVKPVHFYPCIECSELITI